MKGKTSKAKSSIRATKKGVKSNAKKEGFKIGNPPVGKPADTDPAHKFDLGTPEPEPSAPDQPAYEDLGELPPGYEDNHLFLVAKDPQWLFSYWDINWAEYAAEIRSGQVFLRILIEDGKEVQKIAINPYANNWYVPVTDKGQFFSGEIGYHATDGEWKVICSSGVAEVPSGEMSGDDEGMFAKVPLHISFEHLLSTVKSAMGDGESLMHVLSRLQSEGSSFGGLLTPDWTEDRKRILEALLGHSMVEQLSMNSDAIDDVLRKQIGENLSSIPSSVSTAKLSGLAESGPTSLSSGFESSWSARPFSKQESRGFFMHVNAEVIFYGGTHPDARVWIDGEEIDLQPDGTFSYHFKFPDGKFEVPIVAESPDGKETRSATLAFKRDTTRHGEVSHTAQPAHLGDPMGKKG